MNSTKLLLVGLLLTLAALPASAGGINMAWNDCGSAGSTNKSFACDSNTGNHDIFLSFDPGFFIAQLVGGNPFIDIEAAGTNLPDWWQFKNTFGCRTLGMTAPSITPASCFDTWKGQDAPAVVGYLVTFNTPSMPANRARLIGSVAIPRSAAVQSTAGTEYHLMALRINNSKTLGTGACSGCATQVCLSFPLLSLSEAPATTYYLDTPLYNGYITWQDGGATGNGCAGATPAVNRTWGQLKSIYR
ncbi:MAG TPA: hypothetical protein VJY35_11765 [Candidatus Eisenbacteria bacterium]|nr:hypothetical protein [Candidatus Eisenbacteria bacterium]